MILTISAAAHSANRPGVDIRPRRSAATNAPLAFCSRLNLGDGIFQQLTRYP